MTVSLRNRYRHNLQPIDTKNVNRTGAFKSREKNLNVHITYKKKKKKRLKLKIQMLNVCFDSVRRTDGSVIVRPTS